MDYSGEMEAPSEKLKCFKNMWINKKQKTTRWWNQQAYAAVRDKKYFQTKTQRNNQQYQQKRNQGTVERTKQKIWEEFVEELNEDY